MNYAFAVAVFFLCGYAVECWIKAAEPPNPWIALLIGIAVSAIISVSAFDIYTAVVK